MQHELNATEDGQRELVIRWNPETDDPMGFLNGWILKGHMEAFLRVFPHTMSGGNPKDADDAYHLARGLNWLVEMTSRRLEFLMLLLRDQYGLSWDTLGNATEVSRSTAKDRYKKIARQYAEHGDYVDETGPRSGKPALVQQLVEDRIANRDSQDLLDDLGVQDLGVGDRVCWRRDRDRKGTVEGPGFGTGPDSMLMVRWDDRDGALLTSRSDIARTA
jgi:hypothetical protein